MKTKRQRRGRPVEDSRLAKLPPATQVAKAAGVSRVLARRKLLRGESPEQIIEAAARRREVLEQRTHQPIAPTNDRAAAVETFVAAQTRKEIALADLRELEAKQKGGALVEAAPLCQFVSDCAIRLRDDLLRLVETLRGHDYRDAAELVDREVHRVFGEQRQFAAMRAGEVLGLSLEAAAEQLAGMEVLRKRETEAERQRRMGEQRERNLKWAETVRKARERLTAEERHRLDHDTGAWRLVLCEHCGGAGSVQVNRPDGMTR